MFFHLSNIPPDPLPDTDNEDDTHLDTYLTLFPPAGRGADGGAKRERRTRRGKSNGTAYTVLTTFLFTSAAYLAIGVGILFSRGQVSAPSAHGDKNALCVRHTSQYSPLVHQVDREWHMVRFNGSLLHENVYRQGAGPEVDAAWEALGVDYRPIVVPVEEAERSGLRDDQVKVKNVYGGGYIANVEGLHHLHCLNILRKLLKWNYDYYLREKKPPFSNSEVIVRFHVTHCLDILRQQLMCVPDIGVLGQVWGQPEAEAQPIPFVDFNTEHRCRNYEGVRQWAEEHQLPPEEDIDLQNFYQMPGPDDGVYHEIP